MSEGVSGGKLVMAAVLSMGKAWSGLQECARLPWGGLGEKSLGREHGEERAFFRDLGS